MGIGMTFTVLPEVTDRKLAEGISVSIITEPYGQSVPFQATLAPFSIHS